jgi:hypothetical protein
MSSHFSQAAPEGPQGPVVVTKTHSIWKNPVVIFLIVLVILLTVALIAMWWYNRPIKPVVLTQPETQQLHAKIEAVDATSLRAADEPSYVEGGRNFVLTEREINGLLNQYTGLGDKVKIELGRNRVFARLVMKLPDDFPIMAGQTLRARARFDVDTSFSRPSLVLSDVSLWGISLPNSWLGGMKDQDMLGWMGPDVGKTLDQSGFKEIAVENRQLVFRLSE